MIIAYDPATYKCVKIDLYIFKDTFLLRTLMLSQSVLKIEVPLYEEQCYILVP